MWLEDDWYIRYEDEFKTMIDKFLSDEKILVAPRRSGFRNKFSSFRIFLFIFPYIFTEDK